jgi:hypothetical protein
MATPPTEQQAIAECAIQLSGIVRNVSAALADIIPITAGETRTRLNAVADELTAAVASTADALNAVFEIRES